MTLPAIPRRTPFLLRLRITIIDEPAPAWVLADTPDRHCRHCHGDGGWLGGLHWDRWIPCMCWEPDWQIRLTRIPRFLAERRSPLDRRSPP
ncbi:hypothetical protein [Kitasatospora aureofaciens]|uniref:hypothetical protein n=1 Tax=Kitasatospora aureofaciens TaxID=1894 RepID=UPI0037C89639